MKSESGQLELRNSLSGSIWLSLAVSGSLWLTLWLSLALSQGGAPPPRTPILNK